MNGWLIYVHDNRRIENHYLKAFKCHGAKLENFFSKKVTHCIVNSSGRTRLKKDVAFLKDKDPRSLSRGEKILLRSKTKIKDDLMDKCRAWNVVPLERDDLPKIFHNLCGGNCIDYKSAIKLESGKMSARQNVGIRRLKPSFIRVDDQSGRYRPLILEFKEWPVINYNSNHHGSPFDTKGEDMHADREMISRKPKRQYCECCRVFFDDMQVHLGSKQHIDFATNPDNYKDLDALIAKYPFEKYLDDVKKKYS